MFSNPRKSPHDYILWILLLLTSLVPNFLVAASFDCTHAHTTLEVLICADPDLSALDGQVGQSYFQLLSSAVQGSNERVAILEEQRTFLQKRVEICPIPAIPALSENESNKVITCLKGIYTLRLNELQKQVAGSANQNTQPSIMADSPLAGQNTGTQSNTMEMPPPLQQQTNVQPDAVTQPDNPTNIPTAPQQEPARKEISTSPLTQQSDEPQITPLNTGATFENQQASNDDNTSVALVVLVAVGALYVIFVLARKLNQYFKKKHLMKIRELINAKYTGLSKIGSYASRRDFCTAYTEGAKDKSSEQEIEFLPVTLIVAKPASESHTKWKAMIGHMNEPAYNTAMTIYNQSCTQWKIGKAQFEQQERQNRGINERASSRMEDSVPRPLKPDRAAFINYEPVEGECSAHIPHDYILVSATGEIASKRFGTIKIDPTIIEENLLAIYKDVFIRISQSALVVDKSDANTFPPIDDQKLFEKLSGEIGKKLNDDAKSQLGNHFKNLECASTTYCKFERNEFEFPIGLIIAAAKSDKIVLSFRDHADPRIIIGEKQIERSISAPLNTNVKDTELENFLRGGSVK